MSTQSVAGAAEVLANKGLIFLVNRNIIFFIIICIINSDFCFCNKNVIYCSIFYNIHSTPVNGSYLVFGFNVFRL